MDFLIKLPWHFYEVRMFMVPNLWMAKQRNRGAQRVRLSGTVSKMQNQEVNPGFLLQLLRS